MDKERTEILQGLRSQLRYHDLLGIQGYPQSQELLTFLSKTSIPHQQASHTLNESLPREISSSDSVIDIEPESTVSLSDICDEVKSCHACELHKQRIYPVAGQGPEKVRVMVIGDWLAADHKGDLPPGQLFGVEQDIMLGRMLGAINLSRQEVFITNVIKCAVIQKCQPQADHVESCSSFLRRQILVLKPELICTMGMVATRAVLEKSQPLSRLRSQFHDFSPGKGIAIPVLSTYHPTYLLQNPEMKRATWEDLQLLAKKLGLQVRS